jgi:hypothetical protein
MSSQTFSEEEKLAQAIENTKRQIAKKFNTKLAPQKELWDKFVLNFRESMITEMRKPDVSQVIEYQPEPWVIHSLPSLSSCLKRLLKESFDSDDTAGFQVKAIEHQPYIYADLCKLLPIVEKYTTEISNKRRRVAPDIESGLMVVDDKDSETSANTKESVTEKTLGLIREFIAENTKRTTESGVLLEDFIIFSFWCTWLYHKEKNMSGTQKIVIDANDRPGRRSFMELFLKETGLVKTVVKKRNMIEGIRVRATPQTPWLPSEY